MQAPHEVGSSWTLEAQLVVRIRELHLARAMCFDRTLLGTRQGNTPSATKSAKTNAT